MQSSMDSARANQLAEYNKLKASYLDGKKWLDVKKRALSDDIKTTSTAIEVRKHWRNHYRIYSPKR